MSTLVLNVDDYQPALYARQRALQRHGFVVVNAATGRDALALNRRHRPAVMLLDVGLPDMNGLEVARQVKAAPDSAPIVVHVSATHRGDGDRLHGLIYGGADAYLVEPVDPEVLVGTIQRLLDARSE